MATATYNSQTMAYSHSEGNVKAGLGMMIGTTGKFPLETKRVFATLSDASGYTTNINDTACAGLVLTVTGDTSTKNGAYMVSSGGTGENGLQLTRVGGVVNLRVADTPTEGYLKTYELTVDGQVLDTKIDIPKDYLVKSVSSYTITTQEQVETTQIPSGHTCLDFVVNVKTDVEGHEEQDQHTYIDLTETLSLHLDASGITATELTNADLGFTGADDEPNKVFISGNTVAQQLQSIGIQIKNHRGRVSSSGQTEQILTLYDDGIGIVSGATWDCGEW